MRYRALRVAGIRSYPGPRAAVEAMSCRPQVGAICQLLLLLVVIVGGAAVPTQAVEPRPDLTELGLEDLMYINVLSKNVLGTHTHLGGEWMVDFSEMFMSMNGNLDGTTSKSPSEVLQDFPVTPTKMTMRMHMMHVMYAPTDRFTLVTMLHFIQLSMDHVTRTGAQFTTASGGIGDIKVEVIHNFIGDVRRSPHRFLLNAGISLPTGSINERDDTPAGPNQKLPYPMQLGSGTFDLHPGITYLGQGKNWAWMAQTKGTIRLGKNSNDYSLGDRLHLTAWGTRRWTDWIGQSFRVDHEVWGNINGADPDLNPLMVPTADPGRRGGKATYVSPGLNIYIPSGDFESHRFAIEARFPVYQSLVGPQLENDWRLTAGWNYTF